MWIKLRNDRYINASHVREIEGFLTHEFVGEEGDEDRKKTGRCSAVIEFDGEQVRGFLMHESTQKTFDWYMSQFDKMAKGEVEFIDLTPGRSLVEEELTKY